jgi:hydrogenase maturation protease
MSTTSTSPITTASGGPERVLVAGVGNIFLGDDGFGVEVAQRLSVRPLPPGVRVGDFGIRGIHLAYELLDGYDALVLIDAMPLGEAPGTLAMVDPEDVGPPATGDDLAPVLDAHTMHPGVVLGMMAMLGAQVKRVVILGCQPESFDGIGLSPAVAEAVDVASELLEDILNDICSRVGKET